eukprot:CAMPEP_0171465282 /NCGR_PEP_ID=MMETSP0945-20130129/8379_1 /TAXON_ID=109269 /ORGANISM="Vaucheria litorea, Strain CCMP2940" /LENGTH=129 /DNA_ID=CAMNT_0011992771 /DNA_START=292 /DNA_END=678 /DNA_ORIENTATION=+
METEKRLKSIEQRSASKPKEEKKVKSEQPNISSDLVIKHDLNIVSPRLTELDSKARKGSEKRRKIQSNVDSNKCLADEFKDFCQTLNAHNLAFKETVQSINSMILESQIGLKRKIAAEVAARTTDLKEE